MVEVCRHVSISGGGIGIGTGTGTEVMPERDTPNLNETIRYHRVGRDANVRNTHCMEGTRKRYPRREGMGGR